MTDTYIEAKKSDMLKYLKIYHSFYKTRSKVKYPIDRLKSDYKSEL